MTKPVKIIFYALMVLFLGAAVFFGLSYIEKEDAIKQSEAVVEKIREDAAPVPQSVQRESDTSVPSTGSAIDASVFDPMYRTVDFAKLNQLNSQVRCWVYIPNTTVDYYVMQEQTPGVYQYLWRNIYNQYSSIGSVLTPAIPNGYEDAHLMLFGHTLSRSRNVMFNSIINFNKKAYFDEHPYVYLYYPGKTERWAIYEACHVYADDIVYNIPYTLGSDEYDAMLQHLDEMMWQKRDDAKPTRWDKTLILSCCDRGWATNGRAILVCKLDQTYYSNTGKLTVYNTVVPDMR